MEYHFLAIVANELTINKTGFNDLFHQELTQIVIKSEFERFQQFYCKFLRNSITKSVAFNHYPFETIAIKSFTETGLGI